MGGGCENLLRARTGTINLLAGRGDTTTTPSTLRKKRRATLSDQSPVLASALLGALAHLPALALKAARALLLPLPAHLGVGLFPRVGLVATAAQAQHQVKGRLCKRSGREREPRSELACRAVRNIVGVRGLAVGGELRSSTQKRCAASQQRLQAADARTLRRPARQGACRAHADNRDRGRAEQSSSSGRQQRSEESQLIKGRAWRVPFWML